MACRDTTENCNEGGIAIPSSEKFVDTGFDLVAGKKYSFSAKGKWCDWFIECDADGYPSDDEKKLLQGRLRFPEATWFCLIGSIDKENFFRIGTGRNFVPEKSGRLFCFANDLPLMYGNNKGCVCLTITEILIPDPQNA